MKRTLGILLAIMMILSTVSFAAPSMTGVVNTAKEASDADVEQAVSTETAGLTAEDRGEPVLLREWTFDNDLEGVVSRNSTDKNSTYEYQSGVEEGNWWIRTNNTVEGKTADPYGEFLNLNFAAENVTSIEVKIKKDSDIGDTFALYYVCNNGSFSANVTQTYSGTEWQTIKIDPAKFNTTWNGTFTKFRLDPGNKAETTYYIDYVRIYGYHNFTPGINVITGTEETLGFENLGETKFEGNILYDGNGKKIIKCTETTMAVADTPVAGETGKALKITGHEDTTISGEVWAYDSLNINGIGIGALDDNRPVFVTFKSLLADADFAGSGSSQLWVMKDNPQDMIALNAGSGSPMYKRSEAPAWKKNYVRDEVVKNGVPFSYIQFRTKAAKTYAEPNWEPITYIDDIGYYPYYKVTYMNGNEVFGTAYVLDDGKGNILESFNPSTQGVEYPEGKNGWALTDGGEKVTSVALENEDIVLYAVAGAPDSTDSLIYSYEFNSEEEVSHFDRNESSSVIPYYDNGNAVFHKDVQKADGTWQGDSRLVFTSSSMPKLNFSKIKRIVVRIKATALDYAQKSNGDGTYTPVAFDWTGTDLTTELGKTNLQICANISSTWTYPISQFFSTMTPDEEGYYLFDVDTTASTAGFEVHPTLFLLLIHQRLVAPVKFEVDYIRLYGTSGAEFSPAVNAPQKREGFGLRVDSAETTGVRFKAAISNDLRAKAELAEYGWIVALADVLGKNELTHQFKAADGRTSYVTGKSYCKINGNNIDKIYETEENYKIFTAVVTGVPVEYADRYLVVRPYSVVGGAYVYGESLITCPRDVGQKLYDKWVAAGSPEGDTKYDYVKYKDYIDTLGIKK